MRRSISRILADRAAESPRDIVVVDDGGTLTAGQLDEAATRLAHALVRGGVRRDDLVAVTLPGGRDFVVACAAIWRAGATPHPVSRALSPEERAALESIARPSAAIGRRPETAGIAWFPDVDAPSVEGELPDVAASSWKAPATSGSTGRPKVVQAAGPALLDPTKPVAAFLPLHAVQLVAGPMTHSATFTYAFRGLLTGHRLVVLPAFDERRWIDAVERHGVTWALLVPTMMHRLLRLPPAERAPERVRTIESVLHMGAPCASGLKRAFLDWLGPDRVVEVYAGSESNGLTMIRGDEWLAHPGSVGRPVGGTEIRIRRADGTAAAPGEEGEVWMRRGAEPAYRYLGATSRRDDEGWDTLGDLGFLDEEGYLHLLDRVDDVINRGGEKVYPAEVESVLERHPLVRSAVAFGVPDPEWGERIAAVADVAGAVTGPGELESWARERLGVRAPERIRIVHDPVRNDAGKTSRARWRSSF